jgi:putative ATP-binding cassette transporter
MQDVFRLLSFLARLSRETPRSRLRIAVISAAGVASGLASTGLIALINSILNGKERPGQVVIGAFIGLCLVLPVSRFLSQVLLVTLTQKTLLALRVRLSGRVLAAPLRQLETLGAPRLLATLTNDIGVIIDSLGLVPILCMNLAIVVSCLAYLGWLSWVVLLEITAFIVVGIVTYQFPLKKAMVHFQRSRARLDEILGQVRALTEGAKDLKMSRARRWAFLDTVEASTDAYQVENRRGTVVLAAASSWGQVLFFLVLGFLVLVLPEFQAVEKRTLIGYTIVLLQMMAPLEVVLTAFPMLSRATVAARVVEELGLSLQPEGAGERRPVEPPEPRWSRLELVGITHTYKRENEDETFQLGPVDAVFEPGELVFIVGGNGSGKTTLAKLLVGLYVPESGEIRFAGRPVTAEDRDRYREHFAVVFSDFFLFERLLGLEASPGLDEQARWYLERLQLDSKVRVEGGTLSTLDLSQGQRKRLALLTAYLEDRPIYLFDEWTADQDPVFKEVFYKEILPELKARGKTMFVISHDDSYYYLADRILQIKDGKVRYDSAQENGPPSLIPGRESGRQTSPMAGS